MSENNILPGIEVNPLLLSRVLQGVNVGLQMTGVKPKAVGAMRTPNATHQLSVLIGLMGDWTGTLAFNLSHRAAILFTGALLGEEQDEFSEDCLDAIGEVANMIAGAFKDGLEGSEMEFANISCPTIVMGASYDFYHATGFTQACALFEIDEIPLTAAGERVFSVSVSMMKR